MSLPEADGVRLMILPVQHPHAEIEIGRKCYPEQVWDLQPGG